MFLIKGKVNKKPFQMLISWGSLLIVASSTLLLFTYLAYKPGFYTNDSLDVLKQALGDVPLVNWHPQSMTLLWALLIKITGHLSSLFILQIVVLWFSLCLLSIVIYKLTKSKAASLFPLGLGASPFIFNIAGVVWKDVQLGFSLLFLVVVLIYYSSHKRTELNRYVKIGCFALSLGLLTYAGSVRHNGLAAAVPLAVLVAIVFKLRLRWRVILPILVFIFVVGFNSITSGLFNIKDSHVQAAVMVDDIKELNTYDKLMTANVNPELKGYLVRIKTTCEAKQVTTNALFLCDDVSNFITIMGKYYPETFSLWLSSIRNNPIGYIRFRSKVYLRFLNVDYLYIRESFDVIQNPYSITVTRNIFNRGLHTYTNLSIRDFGFIYRPYFWLLLTLILLAISLRQRGRFYWHIVLILISGLLYTLAYFPVVIVNDYRMSYWLVISTSLGVILLYVNNHELSHARRQDKS